MQLLALDEVRIRLENLAEQHSSLSELFRLPAAAYDREAIAACSCQFGVNLPNSFSEIALKYDFGKFTLGFVAFGHTGDYFSALAEWNGKNWWGLVSALDTSLLSAREIRLQFSLIYRPERSQRLTRITIGGVRWQSRPTSSCSCVEWER